MYKVVYDDKSNKRKKIDIGSKNDGRIKEIKTDYFFPEQISAHVLNKIRESA